MAVCSCGECRPMGQTRHLRHRSRLGKHTQWKLTGMTRVSPARWLPVSGFSQWIFLDPSFLPELSVAWNLAREAARLATASWDGSVKVWDPLRPQQPVASFDSAHGGGYVYQARWSPHSAGMLLSAGADGAVRVWDIRQPGPVLVRLSPAVPDEHTVPPPLSMLTCCCSASPSPHPPLSSP